MSAPLWEWDELVSASGGTAETAPAATITGVSIDSRDLSPGGVFVALKDKRDGHAFVPTAFQAGAAAALVSAAYQRQAGDGALIRVTDPLAALERVARAARARLSQQACIIAVTGSVGKTSSKEMLRVCLSRLGATHASERSYNNHWGVPLTLARMPRDTRYGVFEIGMNHSGEITPLTRLVRPHAAIITTVEPVHLGHFPSVEAIADAKAEILAGLAPGGIAILNRDNAHFERLAAAARAGGAEIVPFGIHAEARVRLVRLSLEAERSELEVDCAGGRIAYAIAAPGRHMAINSLAVLAAIEATGADFESTIHAIEALAGFGAQPGRGARETLAGPGGSVLLVDESYNANPASMRAALLTLAQVPRANFPRRVAVLGDMLELGERSAELHAGLAEAVVDAAIDLVYAAGPDMRSLFDQLEPHRRGGWAPASDGLIAPVLAAIEPGDAVMVKGSYGSRMAPIVDALRKRFASPPPSA